MLTYKQLQGSGLVRAAAVGSFTRPNVRQLVIFKEMALEIWEFEEEKPIRVANTELWIKVCNCVLLQTPWGFGNLSSTSLDRILVTNEKGNISILEWSISIVRDVAIKVVCVESEKLKPVLHNSVFSKPLTLRGDTPLSCLVERSREMDTGAKDWFGKIRSITLVAMAVYQNLIQVLVAAWVPVTHYQKTNLQGTISHRPVLNDYHLNMNEEPGLISIATQLQRVPSILDLAFIEGLDWKGRPLLVVLSAQDGLVYNLVTVQCFALDLAEGKIQQGPWKICNLHPTSTFVLPWSQDGISLVQHHCGETEIQYGIKEGTGVLVISSRGLLFIDSMGHRASLSLAMTLDGTPTSFDIIKDLCLVLGDSSGALYVLDLKQWDQHVIQKVKESGSYSPVHILLLLQGGEDEMLNSTRFMFFSSGKTCNSKFFTLCLCLISEADTYQAPLCGERDDISVGTSAAVSSLSSQNVVRSMTMKGALSWCTMEILTQPYILDDITCVRDMILIDDPQQSPQVQVLVACGAAPNATVRRGTLGVAFNSLMFLDDKIGGLPQMIPLKCNMHSEHHTHVLLSYAAQGRSEIITVGGEVENRWHTWGLKRDCCTLAGLVVSGGWLVQVTSCSMRVLSFSDARTILAEWMPPLEKQLNNVTECGPKKNSCQNIIHASLCIDGAVLATNVAVYSLKFTNSGKVETFGTSLREHEVSALGVFEFWIAGDSMANRKRKKLYAKHLTSPRPAFENADLYFIVVVAHWHTNTVHLLTWPDLEEMVSTQAGCAPVRCVHVTTLGSIQYLVVGNSDGNVLYFEIIYKIPRMDMDTHNGSMNTQISKSTPTKYPGPSNYAGERESLSCSTTLSHLRTSVCHKDNTDQSLKKFHLKLLFGKCLRLGGSIEYMVSGPICGPEFDFSRTMRIENPDCLLVQGDQSIVLCPTEDGQLQAFYVWGSTQPFRASSRVHTTTLPNGLLVLSKSGHLVLGHLDMSVKLQLREFLDLKISSLYTNIHKFSMEWHASGLEIIHGHANVLQDGGSLRLSLMNIQSMCQVLTLELGPGQHATALKVLWLPCLKTKAAEACKECIIVASQKCNKEHPQGTILFFEFNHHHPCDQEIQYELCLLGVHCTDLPCHAICLLESQGEALSTAVCDICNISSYIEDFEPLDSAVKHLMYGSCHWNDYCRGQEGKRGLGCHSGPMLVLGYNGKVEVFSPMIGNDLTAILLAPILASAIKIAVPSLPGPIPLEGYECSPSCVSDTESEQEDVPICIKSNAAKIHAQPGHALGSLMCLTKLTAFDSPGRGCVLEMLRGVGAFSIQENSEVVQLAWHPFSQPILALIPVNPDLYMISTYERGLQLMGRNYVAEQAFQDEEKRLRDEDVERGFGMTAQSRPDADVRGHQLPGFSVIDTHPSPATGLHWDTELTT